MSDYFKLADDQTNFLWDYGWFKSSRFTIDAKQSPPLEDAHSTIDNFVNSKIFPRSYCSKPNLWGADIQLHGPYVLAELESTMIEEVNAEEFRNILISAFVQERFNEPPTADQQAPVLEWLDEICQAGTSFFSMPKDAKKVEWADTVWWVYEEVLAVNLEHGRLDVGVLGYD